MQGTRPIATAVYLTGQLVLAVLLVLTLVRDGVDTTPLRSLAGWALCALGLGIAVASAFALREAFTPFPAPRPGASLHTRGPFRRVRHPLYSGLIAAGGGIVLLDPSVLRLSMLAAFVVLLWRKAALEERLLAARFPGYAAYIAETGMFAPRVRRC